MIEAQPIEANRSSKPIPFNAPALPVAPAPQQHRPRVSFVAIGDIKSTFGVKASSAIYRWIGAGLMIEPIKLSTRVSRWLSTEPQAIAAARAAGKTDDEIRALVASLRQQRANLDKAAA